MSAPLRIAISPCPNDTYAFAGLLSGALQADLAIELADIQALNEGFAAGRWDVAKASFSAVLAAGARVLPVGAALGFGVGPVLLAREPVDLDLAARAGTRPRVLAPGPDTTAALLFDTYHPELGPPEHAVFSAIVPALRAGRADLGVCIHEARFTWRQQGLALVEDLGERWEADTGLPLPLGGLVARDGVPAERLADVIRAVRASLDWSDRHRDAALAVMRAHAQEQADDVIWRHVELYVNDHTRALGPRGERALAALLERVRAAGRARPGARVEVLPEAP